jgi:hypothetical protein
MRNELSIYLREELLTSEDFDRLLLESEAYPVTLKSDSKSSVMYNFIAEVESNDGVNLNGRKGEDCEITGKKSKTYKYIINFRRKDTLFNELPIWEIVFGIEGHDMKKSVGGGNMHFANVMKTVMDAALVVSKEKKIRFFTFYGVEEATTLSCVGGKMIDTEDVKRRRAEKKGKIYKKTNKRSLFYARSANKRNPNSTFVRDKYVVVDMAGIMPELFNDDKNSECTRFSIELQKAGMGIVTELKSEISCNNGKLRGYTKRFTHQGEVYWVRVQDSNNLQLSKSVDNKEELVEEYIADSMEDLVSKIDDYMTNPIINIDVKDILDKLTNQLLGADFKVVNKTEVDDNLVITYTHELDEEAHIKLILSEGDRTIHLRIEEVYNDDDIVIDDDELSTINIKKLFSFTKAFMKKVKPQYESDKFNRLSVDAKIDYLVEKPNIEFEYNLLYSMFGKPFKSDADNDIGYIMRYRTQLNDGQVMYEDLTNDNHKYHYSVKFLDVNKDVSFFKHFDVPTIKKMLETRLEFRNSISSQLSEV